MIRHVFDLTNAEINSLVSFVSTYEKGDNLKMNELIERIQNDVEYMKHKLVDDEINNIREELSSRYGIEADDFHVDFDYETFEFHAYKIDTLKFIKSFRPDIFNIDDYSYQKELKAYVANVILGIYSESDYRLYGSKVLFSVHNENYVADENTIQLAFENTFNSVEFHDDINEWVEFFIKNNYTTLRNSVNSDIAIKKSITTILDELNLHGYISFEGEGDDIRIEIIA